MREILAAVLERMWSAVCVVFVDGMITVLTGSDLAPQLGTLHVYTYVNISTIPLHINDCYPQRLPPAVL